MKRIPKLFRILFAVAFWIFVWWAAAKSVGSELLFPAPAAVFRVLWALVRSKEFYLVTGRSLLNVVTGILAAVALGVLLAGLCHRVRILRDLFLHRPAPDLHRGGKSPFSHYLSHRPARGLDQSGRGVGSH